MYTVGKEDIVNLIISAAGRVNEMFQRFILGKTVDSAIIGGICYIGMLILDMPFAVMLSVIVGVTNMIPYFGPLIGAIPSVLIVLLTEGGSKALILAIFILILQQFDGNVLGPKILGDAIGVSPLWIIFSIIIGGAAGGPFGMFIGVPVVASIKMFMDEFIDKKYNEKFFYENSGSQLSLEEEDYPPPGIGRG